MFGSFGQNFNKSHHKLGPSPILLHLGKETGDTIVYRPLKAHADCFCGHFDCGNEALWGVSLRGDPHPFALLCDECRQEWVRVRSAYTTPSGWDWDDHEDLFTDETARMGHQLMEQRRSFEPGQIILPASALLFLGALDLTLQVSIPAILVELLLVAILVATSKEILHFLKAVSIRL
jgi:hypothetical protein